MAMAWLLWCQVACKRVNVGYKVSDVVSGQMY